MDGQRVKDVTAPHVQTLIDIRARIYDMALNRQQKIS